MIDAPRLPRDHAAPFIVAASDADAPAILELQKRAYQSKASLYNDWTIPPLLQDIESLQQEISSITVLKAVEGDTIVGSVRAALRDRDCLVGKLIVEPALQRRGIGGALLQAVEAVFPQAEAFELFTGSRSDGNIRLYRRHGYQDSGTKRVTAQLTLVIMRKRAATAD